MVRRDDERARSIATQSRVREPILDTRVNVQVQVSAGRELGLDTRDQRPHQTAATVTGVDQNIEQARATARPGRPRDGEADQCFAIPERADHRVRVRYLPPHLAGGEGPRAPLGTFELEHPSTDPPPARISRREH